MVRLGAILLLLSPLLPQFQIGSLTLSPLQACRRFDPQTPPMTLLGLRGWLFAPALAGAAVLLGARRSPGPVGRSAAFALLLPLSFALSTLGSILLTETAASPTGPAVSFPLALLLFTAPILLGGAAFARLTGGGFDGSTGGFARLSIGLLLAVHGLFLMDSGWDLLLPLLMQNGIARASAGAWAAPAGGLLVAAGEVLLRLRPRAAVDSVPASG